MSEIEIREKWECPAETGVPLITMPNVPRPLHGLPPRKIMGDSTWNHVRKRCYFNAGYKCEICGIDPPKGQLHCLEAGTEVMTMFGFKPIEEVSEEDFVAQYEPLTKEITFVNPTSTVKTHVDKKISIGYDNRFNVGYSEKHRMLIEHTINYNNRGYDKRVEYNDVFPEDLRFDGSNRIPTAGLAKHGRGLTTEERVYIALNADGSFQYESDGYNYHTIRVKKEHKKERLLEILNGSSLQHNILTEKDRPDYLGFSIWTHPYCKDFWRTFDLGKFTQEMAKDFIDELCKWDGWEGQRKNGDGKEFNGRCWYTTKKDQADFVQAVAALAGITTTVSITERRSRKWSKDIDNHADSMECLPQINIEFLSKDSRGTQTMTRSATSADEDMYCITVPSTYFVARSKDGYVFITGNCHELYSYDYKEGVGKFERCIAICKQDHDFIHSGRLLTMYKNGNALYPKSYVLGVVEKGFKLIHDYNETHKNQKPLRVYATFLEYLKVPELAEEMSELIDKYEIEFYAEPKHIAKWGEWKLRFGNKDYPTPYASQSDWVEAMERASKNDTVRAIGNPFQGDIFDEISNIIKDC